MNKRKFIIIFVIALITSIIIFLLFKSNIYIEIDSFSNKINVNDVFEIPSAKGYYCKSLFFKKCTNISQYIKTHNDIDTTKIGKYQITYTLIYKKIKQYKKIKTIEIEVADIEKPVIKLKNNSKLTLCPNYNLDKINDYVVTDNYDIDIQNKVTKYVKGNKLYYSAIDESGNEALIERDIEITDNNAPELILNGSDNLYVYKGMEFKEPGFSAYDTCDGNLNGNVKVEGSVDNNKVGDYNLIYTVADSSGNNQTMKRIVHVYDNSIGTNVKKNGRTVYLTFDDGPNAYTQNILDILNRYNVKATFFVTNQFPSSQNLIKNMYDNGHSIGIHTYSHQYKMVYNSDDDYLNDLNNMDKVIYEQTGYHTKLIRFPGGSSNTISSGNKGLMTRLTKKVTELGYTYFDWNVDSGDTSTINSDKIANNVINGMKRFENSIVLMHDIKYVNKDALEKILYYGLSNGYTFLPLTEGSYTAHHGINN